VAVLCMCNASGDNYRNCVELTVKISEKVVKTCTAETTENAARVKLVTKMWSFNDADSCVGEQ